MLHKASVRKDVKKMAVEVPKKTKRKIELSPVKLRRCEASEVGRGDGENENQSRLESLRMEAFKSAWSKIELTIQVCLITKTLICMRIRVFYLPFFSHV